MPFQKGHKLATGRKPLTEEIKNVIELHKEEIKEEAINELAKKAIYKRLEVVERLADSPLDNGVKEIALPIYLKKIGDKVIHSGEIKQIHSEDIKNKQEVLDLTAKYEEDLRKKLLE